jgi:hypothetical protein
MSNSYWIFNLASSLVMDVKGGSSSTSGAQVQGWTQNSPATDNQLWTFEPGPASDPDSFFIKSKLGGNLVLDAGGKGKAILANTESSPATTGQLWKMGGVGGPVNFPIQIESLLGGKLVIDLTGEQSTRGTLLNVWPRGSNKPTQEWLLVPAPGNSYSPKITSIVLAPGPGFTIAGTDFLPASWVVGVFQYNDNNTGLQTSSNFLAAVDLGGNFVSDSQVPALTPGSPGLLQITMVSFPSVGPMLTATFDGSTFKVT